MEKVVVRGGGKRASRMSGEWGGLGFGTSEGEQDDTQGVEN